MTNTIDLTLEKLAAAGKPMSKRQLYRRFAELDIRPAGARTRPALYPENAADLVLQHLGLQARPALGAPSRLLTMPELRQIRAAGALSRHGFVRRARNPRAMKGGRNVN